MTEQKYDDETVKIATYIWAYVKNGGNPALLEVLEWAGRVIDQAVSYQTEHREGNNEQSE